MKDAAVAKLAVMKIACSSYSLRFFLSVSRPRIHLATIATTEYRCTICELLLYGCNRCSNRHRNRVTSRGMPSMAIPWRRWVWTHLRPAVLVDIKACFKQDTTGGSSVFHRASMYISNWSRLWCLFNGSRDWAYEGSRLRHMCVTVIVSLSILYHSGAIAVVCWNISLARSCRATDYPTQQLNSNMRMLIGTMVKYRKQIYCFLAVIY